MKSKSFLVHEFVPKKIYEQYGEKAWRFVDVRLIETMDVLKEHFNLGSITINNYFWGGKRQWSGIRFPESPEYRELSQHSFANALDFVCSHYTAQEVRNYIIDNPHLFPHVKFLEMGVSWVHFDIRNEDHIVLWRKG